MIDVAVADYGAAIGNEILSPVGASGTSSDRLIIRGTCSKDSTVGIVAGLTTCLSEDDGWDEAKKNGEIP